MGVRPLGPHCRPGQVNNSKVGEKEAKVNILKVEKEEVNITDSGMDLELESGKE